MAVVAGAQLGLNEDANKALCSQAKAYDKAQSRLNQNIVEVGDGIVSGVPVVGHIKGGVHYIVGDTEGGDNCMKAASRTTGAVLGAAGGFVVGGPAGAVAGGVAGGAALDGAITGIESGVKGEFKPHG